MTARKRLKALRRRKEIAKQRNIRTNNMSVNPWNVGRLFPFKRQRHGYRLYNI